MIVSLQGKLEAIGSDYAVVNVGGVGYQVFMPTSDLVALGATGKEVKLYTHLHVREDNLSLFGFGSPEELSLFQLLTTVTGIGPKLGLAMLSAQSVDQLSLTIASGNLDMLMTIPGIGRKTGSRIILELKEKIGAGFISTPATRLAEENVDVLTALTSLGYSAVEAGRAVASLTAASELSLEDKIKLALQYFK